MTYSKINDLALHVAPIKNELEEAVQRVVASGWYALGPEVESFEKDFAAYNGTQYCVGVANGTDALELGLRAAGVCEGDEVITVANAGMYSSVAILAIGATPVYTDIDPESFLLAIDHAESLISPKTRAIIVTHLFGRMPDMNRLRALADKHNIILLEDCAQSHNAVFDNKKAGSWGDVSAFSFYPTKNLGAMGDAGAVCTSSIDINSALIRLRQYGWASKYKVVQSGGRNSRMDEMQAAVLSVKLKHLDHWTRQRQELGAYYQHNITHSEVNTPEHVAEHVYHLYVLRTHNRDSLQAHLREQGIATDIHYPLLDYQQPLFGDKLAINLPNAERNTQEILTIPCYPELSEDNAAYIAQRVNEWAV